MDEVIEEIHINDTNLQDIVQEHCYVGVTAKTRMLNYHLKDHNYFHNKDKKPQPVKKKPQIPSKKQPQIKKPNRNIKITELRAVYNCKSCGYRTLDRINFSKHNCNNKPALYVPCTKCKSTNTPEGYLQCPKCTYFTKKEGSLKVHMRIHASGKPYKCTECKFSGKDLRNLIRHYEVAKDLKCFCGFSTHVRHDMVVHKRTHTGVKPFVCGICSYAAADRSLLHRHLKTHRLKME